MNTEMNHRRASRRLWLVIGAALTALVLCLSMVNISVAPQVPFGDKYVHALAYATLMFWFAQLRSRIRDRIAIAVMLLGLGISLEFAQVFSPHHTYEMSDMYANALGIMAGWLAAPPRLPNLLRAADARQQRGS